MRHHIAAGLVPTRKKHKFRELDVTETSTADADASPAQFIDSIIADAIGVESEGDDDDDDLPQSILPPISGPPQPPAQQPCQRRQVPLKELFDYPAEGDKKALACFEFYWKAGVRNLEAELAAYDTSCEQETVMNQDVEMTIFGVSEEDEIGPAVKNNRDTSIPQQPLTPSVKKFDLMAVIDLTH
ncbi:hypothetical protein CPB84DRAFT_1749582 [Gymnopilus junonius]|uniref:Uncharacterized protein n=1 Tax=Gymnopilus junonius TaxID=109634 RepID=A0A9P5TJG7_GYMJU|nr:hypothetical protein CPB84DRAFT_1749582 [Gymnopilus junonius]